MSQNSMSASTWNIGGCKNVLNILIKNFKLTLTT
jgi:hypothetical protein